MLKNRSLVTDPAVFQQFLETLTRETYEFLLENPRYLKIMFWEAAEDWKTWNQITYRPDDITQLHELAVAAKQNGILRQDFDPAIFPLLIINVTTTTLQSLSRYENVLGKLESHQLIDQTAKFVIHGIMEPSLL
ncbi:hypothetical protein [Paenibacillus sp. HW567]|uniref:hypothetical protein n=1 Tax=Paenibacillus sp. HW567 TaxID=1034769 RepID=UPI00037E1179|nr:hypothetical protein [Paenibacillus sp. HW567]